jgi:hypothetical protein
MIIALALLAAAEPAKAPGLVHLSERQLAQISIHCHSPRSWLRYDAAGALHTHPSPNAPYRKVDCVLSALKRSGAEPMGYVANMYAH